VTLGDRDDQAKVRLNHAALRGHVPTLDRLGECDLLGRGQQLVAPDVRKEELQAVGRADENLRLRLRSLLFRLLGLGVGLLGRLADLEPDRLELTLKLLGVFLAEVVLQRERLDLRRLDEAALFSALHECAGMLGFEQLVHLVLRQFLLRLSRCCGSLDLSHCKRNLLGRLGSTGTFNDLVTSKPGVALRYSATAGSLVWARAGKSNSTFPSSFKTRRARKGLPAFDRNPEITSFVRPFSISWRAISGVIVRPATRFQIT